MTQASGVDRNICVCDPETEPKLKHTGHKGRRNARRNDGLYIPGPERVHYFEEETNPRGFVSLEEECGMMPAPHPPTFDFRYRALPVAGR